MDGHSTQFPTAIDASSGLEVNVQIWSSNTLPKSPHTLNITNTGHLPGYGDAYFRFNSVTWTTERPDNSVPCDLSSNDPRIIYQPASAWSMNAEAPNVGGFGAMTTTAFNPTVTIAFRGNTIIVNHLMVATHAPYSCTVDSNRTTTHAPIYNATVPYTMMCFFDGLSEDTDHTLVIASQTVGELVSTNIQSVQVWSSRFGAACFVAFPNSKSGHSS